jgi:hypothetical protein
VLFKLDYMLEFFKAIIRLYKFHYPKKEDRIIYNLQILMDLTMDNQQETKDILSSRILRD